MYYENMLVYISKKSVTVTGTGLTFTMKRKILTMEQKIHIKDWKLKKLPDGYVVNAHVPGDITQDIYQAGLISDPRFGLNFKDLDWIVKSDFEYNGRFTLSAEDYAFEDISVIAKGIDTFSEIFINDILVCATNNMFMEYTPHIKNAVHIGENSIRVRMYSTLQRMAKIDTTGYFGVFNIARLFVRKAQCHFGWDWAPDLCGYGIWQQLDVVCRNSHRIETVNYHAYNDGKLTMFAELNYCVNAMVDDYGVLIEGTAEEKIGDVLRYTIYDPDGKIAAQEDAVVEGKKNHCSLFVEHPRLWWPNGYGDQPLYRYEVVLFRDGREVSRIDGTMAFREIALIQKPTGKDTVGFAFQINGRGIFVRGSNWVPVDCFTGTITEDKYKRLIELAKNANCNLLRVWGGGVYERELFYDLCDREGIMVWQDFMFACGDIPEDCQDWVENTLKECEQQVKRLRVHPCVVYWCGGNEKTGSYALQISRGDRFVDYTLNGLVKTLDSTRPYVRQSPFSYADVGNNSKSGETHCNSFEPSLTKGIVNYRDTLNETETSFYSECAVMGPTSLETFKKYMPEEHWWPMDDCWEERLRDNPYASIQMSFAKRQALYVSDMYGEAKSLESFIAKAMLIHNEMLTAECDHARSEHGKTSGFINWMFSDIWPTGTWSIIDYYMEPKQAYYGLKKAYAPIRVTFVQNRQHQQELVIINDTLQDQNYDLEFGEKNMDGTQLWFDKFTGQIAASSSVKQPIDREIQNFGTYLYIDGSVGQEKVHTLFSVNFWRNVTFDGKYSYEIEKVSDNCVKLHITAKTFVKSLYISQPDNFRYIYSDNYLDLEAGEKKTVTISADGEIDTTKIHLCDYTQMLMYERT